MKQVLSITVITERIESAAAQFGRRLMLRRFEFHIQRMTRFVELVHLFLVDAFSGADIFLVRIFLMIQILSVRAVQCVGRCRTTISWFLLCHCWHCE